MRKKIFVAMHSMDLGGAEAALLGMLQAVDPNKAEVDVMIYDHGGELMGYLYREEREVERDENRHPRFHLLSEVKEYSMLEKPIIEVVKNGYIGIAFGRVVAKILYLRDKKNNRLGLDNIALYHFIAECVLPFLPKIHPEKEYDLAISFLLPHQYVLQKVHANRKLAWLHTDYSKVYVSDKEVKVWQGYDYIGAISEDVGKGFVSRFPALKNRIVQIENILSSEFIRKRSLTKCPQLEQDKSLKLLTIGRYSYPKKLEDIPYLCHRLMDAGMDVHWYVIGYGSEEYRQKLSTEIVKEGMQECVIMLGKQSNPYPYIRSCDVYIQPSRYEGKSITVREAQILGKPVVVTNYPTASSQIQDGVDGVIVPLEREACADALIGFLNDRMLQQRLAKYLQEYEYGNESEIEKIYGLCENCNIC